MQLNEGIGNIRTPHGCRHNGTHITALTVANTSELCWSASESASEPEVRIREVSPICYLSRLSTTSLGKSRGTSLYLIPLLECPRKEWSSLGRRPDWIVMNINNEGNHSQHPDLTLTQSGTLQCLTMRLFSKPVGRGTLIVSIKIAEFEG